VIAPAVTSLFIASSIVLLGTFKTVEMSSVAALTVRLSAMVARYTRTALADSPTGYVRAHSKVEINSNSLSVLEDSLKNCFLESFFFFNHNFSTTP